MKNVPWHEIFSQSERTINLELSALKNYFQIGRFCEPQIFEISSLRFCYRF